MSRFTFHYASTLSVTLSSSNLQRLTFTFHYASTLSRAEMHIRGYAIHIYIPLCFYFILSRDMAKNKNFVFTFHYASTLSIAFVIAAYASFQFTFHYASTLSGDDGNNSALKANLHSTMLLLYPKFREGSSSHETNLHSTMLLLYRIFCSFAEVHLMDIYIPLCFYFIGMETMARSASAYLHSTMLLLYQGVGRGVSKRQDNLHSTMLLLYPWGDRVVFFELRIYIPLCFYFITAVCLSYPQTPQFTFHYASTLSGDDIMAKAKYTRFTFHYASTLSQSMTLSYSSNI